MKQDNLNLSKLRTNSFLVSAITLRKIISVWQSFLG